MRHVMPPLFLLSLPNQCNFAASLDSNLGSGRD
jgi:hypothetical protein